MRRPVQLFACLVIVTACASSPVPPSVVTTLLPDSSLSAPQSPLAVPSSTPTQTPRPAQLIVTGTGSCGGPVVIFYGACLPILLLAPKPDADFSDWVISDNDYFFQTGERGASEIPLTGRLGRGPSSLAPGSWTVGLGVRERSDDLSTPETSVVLCTRPFEVAAGTQRVEIVGHFEQHCSIEVVLDDVPVPVECADDTFYLLDDVDRDQVVTQTFPGTNLLRISVSAVDRPDDIETAIVDMSDSSCQGHRLIGPIVRGVQNGFDPVSTEPADLVGRLMILNNIGVGCSVLIDREGLTWDVTWPDGYTVSGSGLVKDETSLVAEAGTMIGVRGQELRRSGGCLAKTRFRVDEVAFIETPPLGN